MSLTKLEENLSIIENLPDAPIMESTELKRKFDESSIKIKDYINETLTVEIDNIVTQIKKDISSKLLEDNKKKYYVGKLIFDTENVNPSTYLGFGTWQLWGQGRVPVGINPNDSDFNAVEKTGGEKTHQLTIEEMPSHNHSIKKQVDNNSGNKISVGSGSASLFYQLDDTVETNNTGGGQAHNNLQPYITCYIWKRTA